ncbi:hypothetical protein AgCh_021991 [Apium graveolens]
MTALLVKSFKKMAYKDIKKGKRFSRKGSSSSNYDIRSYRKNDEKESRSGKIDKLKIKCYKCDGVGHFAADCRKPKAKKKLALITKKKNWDNTSESDEGYANKSNTDELNEKETEEIKPISTDKKVKLNKSQLRPVRFNLSADGVKSVNKREFKEKACPSVSYGDGNLGKILGYGNIKLGNVIIKNIALVAGLKHNLISVSQICDRGFHVDFYEEHYDIVNNSNGKVAMIGYRYRNLYEARVSTNTDGSAICLLSRPTMEDSWNWHMRLFHLNFNNINELVKKDLVKGLPNAMFTPDGLCDSCQKANLKNHLSRVRLNP